MHEPSNELKALLDKYAGIKRIVTQPQARAIVKRAVANGKLVKPLDCQGCGASNKRLDAHHKDYSKPLEVEWLCRRCHSDRHQFSAVNLQMIKRIQDKL